ncbi:3-coathanger stack domain-containing protein [Emticicia sp. C21]|uniref:3-coathanger stack domain-containing protein n=1 Tax=Emticicia sp. C21 TaxID=2302915 RepID=UPI000E344D09|nr:3-coathanger stack domain-containing protein [Emticicia sp. C21]RFS16817.1 hypothetical protein D0T08_09045 [Emticicia sp. C21]
MRKVLLLLLFSNALVAQPSFHFDLLKDINTQTNDSRIISIQNAGDKAIVFQADRNYNDETYKLRLWKYNGLKMENFASSDLFGKYSSFTRFISIDDYLFFYGTANDGSANNGLYVAHLNSPHIKKVASARQLGDIVKFDNKIYYTAGTDYSSGKLFYYNEITNESVEIQGGTQSFKNPTYLQIINNQLFFTALAADQYNRNELWVSDGTSAGTRKVKEEGVTGSIYDNKTRLGNRIIYEGYNNSGVYLFISDGTEAGTYAFRNVLSFDNSPSPSVIINDLYSFGDKVLILLTNRQETQIWITDGTDANTKFMDTYRGLGLLDNGQLAIRDGFIYYTNWAGELIKTNGTTRTVIGNGFPQDTRMVYNSHDNCLYYLLSGKIYKTDGLSITMVTDKMTSVSEPILYTLSANKIIACFNPSNSSKYGKELYTVTEDSIKIVKDLDSTTKGTRTEFLLNAQGKSYFLAYDNLDSTYRKVFETDGTAEGTRGAEIGDLGYYYNFIAFKNNLYLLRNNQVRKIDFATGTYQVITSYSGSLTTQKTVQTNNKFYFLTSDNSIYGGQLWESDGTAEGTIPIREFNQSDRYMGIAVYNQQLYIFNGTNTGTKILKYTSGISSPTLVKSINIYGIMRTYANFRGKLAFIASISGGVELWTTDGTEAGTNRHYYLPFSSNSNLEKIYFTNSHYYYSDYTFSDGKIKVYKSDGTTAGTVAIFDVSNATSDIKDFCQCNNEVFFGLNQEEYYGKSFLYKHNPVNNTTTQIRETEEIVPTNVYKNFYCANQQLFFTTYGGGWREDKKKLYTSDGTQTGTKSILLLEKKQEDEYYRDGVLYPLNDDELLMKTDDRFYGVEWFTLRKCDNPTNLTGTTADSKIQSSSTFLESSEKLTGDGRVYYFAPKSITLKAGFSVDNSSVFRAEISNRPCSFRQ